MEGDMATNWKNSLKKWVMLISFVVLLVLSGVLLILLPISGIEHKLSESVGHALIIAGILIAPVDYYVKKHLVKEASKDIAQYIVGFPLPDELHPVIMKILNSKLIIRNLHLHYKIIPIDGDPDRITLQVERSFKVQNISADIEPYRQELTFEKHSRPTVQELWGLSSDGRVHYKKDKLDIHELADRESGVSGDLVHIHPHYTNRYLEYEFGSKYSFTFPSEYNEYYFFLLPVIGVTITADFPSDFVFVAPKTKIQIDDQWKYDTAFLTGQQIWVRWGKRGADGGPNTNRPLIPL
jgi:hypothetical protein